MDAQIVGLSFEFVNGKLDVLIYKEREVVSFDCLKKMYALYAEFLSAYRIVKVNTQGTAWLAFEDVEVDNVFEMVTNRFKAIFLASIRVMPDGPEKMSATVAYVDLFGLPE